MFIYLIVNHKTGKYYVGQHKGNNLRKYLKTKMSVARHNQKGGSHLFNAMRKYPQSSLWSIHALRSDIQTREELDETERDFIKFLRSQEPEYGYNICRGGEGRTGPLSSKEKEKFLAANRAYWIRRSLVGQTFGKLTVQSEHGRDDKGKKLWDCRCDCGNHTIIRTNPLTAGSIKSCGCLISEAGQKRWAKLDMVGKVFGKLVVQCEAGRNKRQQRLWDCLCSCGNHTVVKTNTLMTGNAKSCGCSRKGLKWINKNGKEVRVKYENLDSFLTNGWELGQVFARRS
jgi:hypothetical protein